MRTRSTLAAIGLTVSAVFGGALMAPAGATAGASTTTTTTATAVHVAAKPKPRAYKNCTALNKVYKHGVGKKGARDKVRGSTKPVTNFTVDTRTYDKNKARDRDKDGVACEKR